MASDLQLTPEQKREQLATLEAEAARIESQKARLREELAGGVEGQHGKAASDAELFSQMSGQEKGELARSNPERFSQLADAYRAAGERKLFRRTLVP